MKNINNTVLTDEEKIEIDKKWAEAKHKEWIKEHIRICPKCGHEICDETPNGAGELVECDWHCDICGWEEGNITLPSKEAFPSKN